MIKKTFDLESFKKHLAKMYKVVKKEFPEFVGGWTMEVHFWQDKDFQIRLQSGIFSPTHGYILAVVEYQHCQSGKKMISCIEKVGMQTPAEVINVREYAMK